MFFWLNITSYAARFDAAASVFLVTSLDSARSLTSQLKKQKPNCQMPEAGSYFPSACGGLTMIQTSWIVSQAAINTLATWNLCFLLGTTDVTFCSLFGSAHLWVRCDPLCVTRYWPGRYMPVDPIKVLLSDVEIYWEIAGDYISALLCHSC